MYVCYKIMFDIISIIINTKILSRVTYVALYHLFVPYCKYNDIITTNFIYLFISRDLSYPFT